MENKNEKKTKKRILKRKEIKKKEYL